MRLTLRLMLSLVLGITLIASISAYYQVQATRRELKGDLETRAESLAESLADDAEGLLRTGDTAGLQRMIERFGNRQHVAGVAIYNGGGQVLASTPGLAASLGEPAVVSLARSKDQGQSEFRAVGSTRIHIYAIPLHRDETVIGALAIFDEASYIEARSSRLWRGTFVRILLQTIFIAVVVLLIVRWSIAGPIANAARWMRDLRSGRKPVVPLPQEDLLRPLVKEVGRFARSLEAAQAAAEGENPLPGGEAPWTAERLRSHVRSKLQEKALCVVSNREPYMHVRRGKSIEVIVPAGGLVAALEPVLRACGGTWIASGAGDADREAVDGHSHLRVPPEAPQYTLRRVWLSKEEEEGYYYGFSNEGLWPLCHIAHTRPTFRAKDWAEYQKVNEKFAQAVVEETAGREQPVVLIQDYHFALLPRIVKQKRPDARVAIFWHIPWPNPQAFGICPWQAELVDGLLGADLIGFHIQAHCTNFLETVDQAVECRIEWERSAAHRRGHLSLVRPFPISVAMPEGSPENTPAGTSRATLQKELGLDVEFLAVGVDRVDYTKGIVERFLGVERFLEKCPAYQGRFTLVQIGAPSRTHITRYHDLLAEVEAEADRINWRFETSNWKPIVFLKRHHSRQEIQQYYRAADLCTVTSLHDGMNLVAKEFVAARDDAQGVLILSRFTGAARELRDALVVNPYDTEQVAEAIRRGLEMTPEEKRTRMQRMRRIISEHTIYRWAADLISELADLRTSPSEPTTLSTN